MCEPEARSSDQAFTLNGKGERKAQKTDLRSRGHVHVQTGIVMFLSK